MSSLIPHPFENRQSQRRYKHDTAVPNSEYKCNIGSQIYIDQPININETVPKVIDVQPDYRNTVAYVIHYLKHAYPNDLNHESPHTTMYSLVGYNMALIYLYALFNDNEPARTMKSDYSQEISTSHTLGNILPRLRGLLVPPFMISTLESLSKIKSDKPRNFEMVNTFACFDLEYDYARTPPIHLFFTAHNTIIAKQSNSFNDNLIQKWLQTELVNQPLSLTTADFLGLKPNEDYRNWFAQICLSQLNRQLSMPITDKSQTDSIDVYTQVFYAPKHNVNPYLHLLCLDQHNRQYMSILLQELSNSISQLIPDCIPIVDIHQKMSNYTSLSVDHQHLMSTTWHVKPYTPTLVEYCISKMSQHHPSTTRLLNSTSTNAHTNNSGPSSFPQPQESANNEDQSESTPPSDQPDPEAEIPLGTYLRLFTAYMRSTQGTIRSVTCPGNSYIAYAIPYEYFTPVINDRFSRRNILELTTFDHYSLNLTDGSNHSHEQRLPLFHKYMRYFPNPQNVERPIIIDPDIAKFSAYSIGCTTYSHPSPDEPQTQRQSILGWSSYRYDNTHNSPSLHIRYNRHMLLYVERRCSLPNASTLTSQNVNN